MGKTINLDHVTKIEGHARLNIKVVDGNIEKCELQLMEGARFFEGILKGKKFNDVSHITSRICGVCSVVHAIAAVQAVENAFGVKISEQSKKLRELLNIGGMIQSHALHLYFLTLPDYYGKGSALELLKEQKGVIERALRLKRAGNNMVFTVAGRDVHPIGCVVGGFSRVPAKEQMDKLLEELKSVKADAVETVKLFMSLDYPEFEKPTPHFALTGGPYFYSHETMKCDKGTCFPTGDYRAHIKEHFREGMTAEFATKEGKSYFVGALARVINRLDELSPESKVYVHDFQERKNNPFMNIPAQAVEILEGVNRAIELLEGLELVEEENPEVKLRPCECEGIAAVSAPRGVLFHRYKFDKDGYCVESDITTPTTQNLALMEEAISALLKKILNEDEESIKKKIEQLIRAYDPCVSCSTHFLEMKLERV
ncbi:TPA: Ni/Fe hydrogenase subunit alpha [Candidatus Woesearchaeota archaeon]|nr:Ni/Fe hydrogenase subunit alpha [Candidatus Woesearchaeota archaeon]